MGFTGNDGSALAGGLNPSGAVQGLAVDALGKLLLNLAQWNGAAPAVGNPVITEDQVRAYTLAGNAYSATTGKVTAPGVATLAFQLFNPANNTKNILIYSLVLTLTAGAMHEIRKTTADISSIAGYSSAGSNITNNGASATASTATSNYSNVALTGGLLGTPREVVSLSSNSSLEALTNGECIWLPAGAGAIAGICVYLTLAGANGWGVTAEYLEF